MLCHIGVKRFCLGWISMNTMSYEASIKGRGSRFISPDSDAACLHCATKGHRTHLDIPIARCQIVMRGVQTKKRPLPPSPFIPLDAKRRALKSLGWQSEVVGKTTMRNSSADGGGGGRKGHRVIRNSIVGGSARGAACLLLLPPCRTVQPAVASPTRPPTPSITPVILLWTR